MSMNAAVHTHEIEHPKDILGIRIVVGNTIAMAFPDRKSTRLNSSHSRKSRMPSSA